MVDSGETSGDVPVLIAGWDAEAKPRHVRHLTVNKIGLGWVSLKKGNGLPKNLVFGSCEHRSPGRSYCFYPAVPTLI